MQTTLKPRAQRFTQLFRQYSMPHFTWTKRLLLTAVFLVGFGLSLGVSTSAQAGTIVGDLVPLTFPDTDVGDSSVATLTVTRTSIFSPVEVQNVALTDNLNYSITGDTCTSVFLPFNGNCEVEVTYTPQDASIHNLTIIIHTDFFSNDLFIGTSGLGLGARLNPSTNALSFGSRLLGTTSPQQTVTINSAGSAPLEIGTISLGGGNPEDYEVTRDTCSNRTRNPGQNCRISVAFSPTTTGGRPANIRIPSNNANNPVRNIRLRGRGVQNNLSLTKEASVTSAMPGDLISYTITVDNNGNLPVDNVLVEDFLYGDFNIDTAPPAFCTPSGDSFSCDLGTVPGNGQVLITYILEAQALGVISNTARVSGDLTDPTPSDDIATVNVPIAAQTGDLQIAKVATPSASPLLPGGTLEYALTVTNNSAESVDNILVSDTLLGDFNFVGGGAACVSFVQNGDTFICEVGTLASSASTVITYTIEANAVGVLSNIAEVSGALIDTDTTNNVASTNTPVTEQTGNLSIEKSASVATALPGDTITYEVTVTNNSSEEINNVYFDDSLLGDFTLVGGGAGCLSFIQNGDHFTCVIGALADGASIVISYDVQANSTGVLSNIARVFGEVNDTNPNDDVAVVNVPVTAQTGDLQIEKIATPSSSPLLPGDSVAYTIRVTNNSALAVDDVIVTDLTLGEFSFLAPPPPECSPLSNNGDAYFCELGTLASGEVIEINYSVEALSEGVISNIAEVTGAIIEDDITDNLVVANVIVSEQEADLAITKEFFPSESPLLPDDAVLFRIQVTNNGDRTVSGVVINDTIFGDFTMLVTDFAACSLDVFNGDNLFCLIGDLGPSETAMIEYTLSGNSVGVISNVAEVSGAAIDPNPANNRAAVNVPVSEQVGDLAITKVATPSAIPTLPGNTVDYLITVTNNSDREVNDVSVIDAMLGAFTLSEPPTECVALGFNGDTLLCNLGTLAAGESVDFSYTVQATELGVLSNVAQVTGALMDEDPLNNVATVNVVVTDQVGNLSLTKIASADAGDFFLGSTITYTVTVTNDSPDTVAQVFMQDNLVGDFAVVSGLEACVQNSDTFTCDLGALAAGESREIVYIVRTNALGTLTNNARAFGSVIDNVPGDDIATVNVQVIPVPPPEPDVNPADGELSGGSAIASGCALQTAKAPRHGFASWATFLLMAGFASLSLRAHRKKQMSH